MWHQVGLYSSTIKMMHGPINTRLSLDGPWCDRDSNRHVQNTSQKADPSGGNFICQESLCEVVSCGVGKHFFTFYGNWHLIFELMTEIFVCAYGIEGAREWGSEMLCRLFEHKVDDGKLWRHTRTVLVPNHGNPVIIETNCDSFTRSVISVL